ncbi:MAG TPA: D-amino-acid transaminase [Bacteroidales bacterium]|nr:D-amino-acid transaminase [Bacteroidales bacterium]
MDISYINGQFLPSNEISISPDDRGFLFADGIYEVVRWYEGDFFDMEGHLLRLKRSLRELRIIWPTADGFPSLANELIIRNSLQQTPSLLYIQVTRGVAKRSHSFPSPAVSPTIYAFARGITPDPDKIAAGIRTIMKNDIRWARCDIKSVSLLPNILSFQDAVEEESHECIFVKDGIITECAHSNVFFVKNGTVYTHPESESILSGITRKNVIRLARQSGIPVTETAITEKDIPLVDEVFITNTSFEVAPVISINNNPVSDGKPGHITISLRTLFRNETMKLKT